MLPRQAEWLAWVRNMSLRWQLYTLAGQYRYSNHQNMPLNSTHSMNDAHGKRHKGDAVITEFGAHYLLPRSPEVAQSAFPDLYVFFQGPTERPLDFTETQASCIQKICISSAIWPEHLWIFQFSFWGSWVFSTEPMMFLSQELSFQQGVFPCQLEEGHSQAFPSRVGFWFNSETLLGVGHGWESFFLTLAVGPEGHIHVGQSFSKCGPRTTGGPPLPP